MTPEQPRIQLCDLSEQTKSLRPQLLDAMNRVLESGAFIMGPEVAAFESEMAGYLGAPHAVAVNSGTDALLIGLEAAGLEAGDEVITSAFTFFATAEAIGRAGGIPRFVDIDPLTFNIEPGLIESAITERTRAIIPVHLYGQAADMNAISVIAARHNLSVIEDVAQACGGLHDGNPLGTIGTAGAFSFFPSKNLGAFGDGGLITTASDQLANAARALRVHGATKKYYNERLGHNSRLDALQAAMLRVKLGYLDEWNDQRREAAGRYGQLLGDMDRVVLPHEVPGSRHVYHQYTLRILDGKRDHVQTHLQSQGIASAVYYPVPLHRLPIYDDANFQLPETELAASEVLSLPMWPGISGGQQERVASAIRTALNE